MERTDRFTFMPGDLKLVSPEETAKEYAREGIHMPSEEAKAYIAREWNKKVAAGQDVSMVELWKEYQQLYGKY